MQAVFECHPKWRQKAGASVRGFIVETDSRWGTTRHFSVIRIDGSKEDFSWQTCLDGKLPSQKTDVMFALREAIADQTTAFKTRAFDGRPSIQCPLTGEDVGIDNCHVDHVHPYTFEKLATDWLAASGFNLTLVKLGPSPDGYGVELIDPEQRRSWTDFHHRHARLRILSRHANLSEARKY